MPPDPLRKNELFSEEEEGRTDISFSSLPDGKSASRNHLNIIGKCVLN